MRRPAPPEGQVVACPRARQRRGVRQPFRLRGAPERRFGATAAGALGSPPHNKDRPYAPHGEKKAPAAVAALWRAGEGWRTPKASPPCVASAGAVRECARLH